MTFRQEKLKGERAHPGGAALHRREPAQRADAAAGRTTSGIIVQGGLYNALVRSLQQLGLADAFGATDIPLLVLNVTCPLVPDQIAGFCAGKRGVLVVEEGQPEYIEQEIATLPAPARHPDPAARQGPAARCGRVQRRGADPGPDALRRRLSAGTGHRSGEALAGRQPRAARGGGGATGRSPCPTRPPSFCIGCPERPVFSALKLAQQDLGPVHIAADIGCHSFGTFEPFSMGHSILGYGMSLASRAGVSPMMQRRTLSIMGDGGFWHNGLLTGVQSALFNHDDAVLLIFKNGYSSATGTQNLISTPGDAFREMADAGMQSLTHTNTRIESTLQGLGVQWLRTVHTYQVDKMRATLKEAFTSDFDGLKVIVAEGECQLERQRRIKPWIANLLKTGKRVVRVKYGVDEDVCNGDHACIRLSGCPTLTLKDNPDPLKVDPVATVIDGCVGCGLCGENAQAATLCPSFYRAEVVQNPRWHERLFRADCAAPWCARSRQHETHHPPHLRPRRRRRRRADRMAGRRSHGTRAIAAQSTSIPGVAQRTGATTYYLEVFPLALALLQGRRPVFSLNPVPGELDAMVSSELLETVRQIGNGMATPERTLVITSSARSLTTQERMQLADGRADSADLLKVVASLQPRAPCVRHGRRRAAGRHGGERRDARRDRRQRPVSLCPRALRERGARRRRPLGRGQPARLRARLRSGGAARHRARGAGPRPQRRRRPARPRIDTGANG